MGWYYGHDTKAGVINELTQDTDLISSTARLPNGDRLGWRTIAYCYRGNVHSGVLWVVREHRTMRRGLLMLWVERYIGCYILKCTNKEWGYKPMEESAGPYHVSCPLGYLRLVPEFFHGTNKEWRERVIAYHANQAVIRKQKKLSKQLLQDRNVRS